MGNLKTKLLGRYNIVNLGVFCYLVFLSLFQIDPHHDGYIIASASAVSSGLPVHEGAFSQYGPVTPLIAGVFMKLFGVSVLNMRILAAILIFVTYILIIELLNKLEFEKSTSRFYALSWVILNHVITTIFDGSLFLWPSVISTFFLVASVYLVADSNKSKHSVTFLISAGILVALASLTRIQSILVIPVIYLYVMLRKKFVKQIIIVSLGTLVGLLLTLIGLFSIGVLDDFIYQVIMWPLSFYVVGGARTNYDLFQVGLFASLAVAMFVFYQSIELLRKKILIGRKLLFNATIGTFVFIICWTSGKLLQSDQSTAVRLFIGDQLNRILVWPLYFAFVVTVLASLITLTKLLNGKWKMQDLNFGSSYAVLVGLAVTIQIFPKTDIGHIWWITPLFIAPTLVFLRLAHVDFSSIRRVTTVLLVASLFANINYFLKDWDMYSYKPLKGTFGIPNKVEAMKIYEPLTLYLQKNNAVFVCQDGVHSVASGQYASSDRWFVEWGIDLESRENRRRLAKAVSIVVCDKERNYSEDIAAKFGKSIVYFAEKADADDYRSVAILENQKQE